ncbi:MAG: hypothetical protein ABIP44_03865 [Pseudoxanthomonas sp.]
MFRFKAMVLLSLVAAAFSAQARDNSFSTALPNVHWVENASIEVDFDGDGRIDQFAMGVSGDEVVVALRLKGQKRYMKLEFSATDFSCSPATFVETCDMPRPELRAYQLKKEDFEDLITVFDLKSTDIFVQNGKSVGVSVPIGETDPFFFFWNSKSMRLDWLRL